MEFSFGFVLNIIITIFLAIDAPKHNRSPWLWGIFGFLFGPITLGIYLIATGRKVIGWIVLILSIILILIAILLIVAGMVLIFSNM